MPLALAELPLALAELPLALASGPGKITQNGFSQNIRAKEDGREIFVKIFIIWLKPTMDHIFCPPAEAGSHSTFAPAPSLAYNPQLSLCDFGAWNRRFSIKRLVAPCSFGLHSPRGGTIPGDSYFQFYDQAESFTPGYLPVALAGRFQKIFFVHWPNGTLEFKSIKSFSNFQIGTSSN